MRKVLFILVFFLAGCSLGYGDAKIKDCKATKSYGAVTETLSLFGNVKIVTDPKEFVNFNVKVVSDPRRAALYVKKVTAPPRRCGEWRFVTSDKQAFFKIRFVEEGEDFRICFVEDDPGCRY